MMEMTWQTLRGSWRRGWLGSERAGGAVRHGMEGRSGEERADREEGPCTRIL